MNHFQKCYKGPVKVAEVLIEYHFLLVDGPLETEGIVSIVMSSSMYK